MPDLSHFSKLDPHIGELARAAYDFIAEIKPSLARMKRWGFPGFVGNSTIVTICGQKQHVNMQFFHGAHLANPKGLLEGTGKDLRHIKIRNAADLGRDGMREVVLAAIAFDATLRDEGLREGAES